MVLRIGRRASQAGEGPLRAMFNELRTQPPIRRPVKLLIGDPAAMPITWGILRPRILLPADAPHWPPDRARSVLLHELGHVRRWDCATQLLALLACAIYWFNPLVWLTARRMRIERERACDDIVIGRGHSPADYAEYLVRLARDLHTRRMQSVVAVAMARKSGLADRVRAILNANIDRRDLNRRVVAISLAVVLAVLLPLSALRIMRKSGVARAAS
jgi:beta-lactamase regulating signal transducer with metallopeptidase domain